MKGFTRWFVSLLLALAVCPLAAQQEARFFAQRRGRLFSQQPATTSSQTPSQSAEKDKEKEKDKDKDTEEGIPISSDVVRQACGACHKSDEKQRMTRLSYRRTTPEGWQETIRRMASLNGVEMEPETARQVLRYLANNLGLAPEEALPAAFEVERRMIEYKYTDRDTERACAACHSMGRVISQRRSKKDWELLIAMHRGYYPLSDFQAFRRGGPPQTEPGPDGRPPDNRHPMEKALQNLGGAFPLNTPEWSAWSANMRAPRLEGRWALSGYQPGKGPVFGETTIRIKAGTEDEFTTETSYVYARTGAQMARQGKVIVYTGFQWRGRSTQGANDKEGLREVMFVDRARRAISGRWFTGAYDETGMDVKLQRVGAEPVVLGFDRASLKTDATVPVAIYGANLLPTPSASIAPSVIDFGPGVRVTNVLSATPGVVKVEVTVAKDAKIGPRDVFVWGEVKESAVVVYDKMDSIKVRPQAGMARIGGVNFPKQYQQFEAVAYNNGPDGKPDTKDDLNLGVVEVTWSIEEYTATYGDDDKDFVGTIDQKGFFTPNVDGPNPKRKNNANNYGDVWVVAVFPQSGKGPDGKELKTLRARAHLLVTVPLYLKFDQAEVGQ